MARRAGGRGPLLSADPRAIQLTTALRAGDIAAFQTLATADPKSASLRGPGG